MSTRRRPVDRAAVVSALGNGPLSFDGLVRALDEADCSDRPASDKVVDDVRGRVDDDLATLVADGAVVEQHLMTNPPRTLYQLTDEADESAS